MPARIVSAGSSSADRMITLPSGASPSLQGQGPPVVTAAAMAMPIWDLPKPASPAIRVCFPMATRSGQSHSIGFGTMLAAQCETRLTPTALMTMPGTSKCDDAFQEGLCCTGRRSALRVLQSAIKPLM